MEKEGVTVYQFPPSVDGLFGEVDSEDFDIEESGYKETGEKITIDFSGIRPERDNDGDGVATE